MKTYDALMRELDDNQRKAATLGVNAVIAAGAGSGKTRVLASRYVHLVCEKGIPPRSILALTFTRKAAAEMYSRIYATLRDTDHPKAQEAVDSFGSARIETLDAFCNAVARSASTRYGIAPDFSIDNERASLMANELALSFMLEKRDSPSILRLMTAYGLSELPRRLFAQPMVSHSPITRPIDFALTFKAQRDETISRLEATLDEAYRDFARLTALSVSGEGKMLASIRDLMRRIPERPSLNDKDSFSPFLAFAAELALVRASPLKRMTESLAARDVKVAFKDTTRPLILSLVNFILNETIIEDAFRLLSEFQEAFNERKRKVGILTFTDVARLAVDALLDDPDLRASYKAQFKSIMIDEFQDDNELQRDLLFLLAERLDRRDSVPPSAADLCPDKLFFVGDEKQSIYRFRGADVSVFRALARDFTGGESCPLAVNYRSSPALISAFNRVFPRVFLSDSSGGEETPEYEARFAPILGRAVGPDDNSAREPSVTILVYDKRDAIEDDESSLTAPETEAFAVAREIARLVNDGTKPDDIAILFRSMTHQRLYENFLRRLGIPCQAESLKSLFADAPINDIYSLLRLACYPRDRAAYAVLLRSPLVAVSDHAFAIASLAAARGEEPFEEALAADMDQDDSAAFLAGRKLWLDIRAMADHVPAHRLITHVWYQEGYRYVVETDIHASAYRELYDYFFELARKADERGQPLAAFLDEIADLAESQEKVEGLDIPIDRGGGVRLMTIHKSKGLEFPIVFLVDGANSGNNKKNSEPVYFSRDWGLSINALSPSGAKDASLNWCYEEGKEEQARMDAAELRRLLYVGMTRAEKRLFVTASVSVRDADEDDESEVASDVESEVVAESTAQDREQDNSTETATGAQAEPGLADREANRVRLILATLLEKRTSNAAKKQKRYLPKSFIEMLSGALAGEAMAEVSLRLINAATWHDVSKASAERRVARHTGTSRPTTNPFSASPLFDCPSPSRRRYPASLLHSLLETNEGTDQAEPSEEARADGSTPNAIDQALLRANLSPADFGTLAHAVIDARLTGRPAPSVSSEVDALAASMADRFMNSELASLALQASWRRTEYGFLSRYELGGTDYVVSGQADLVFEYQDTVYVVDYKTDSLIEPDRHALQLDAYRRAMEAIRDKPTQTWLYYLRTGEAMRIEGLSGEKFKF